jgi:hypothetical protein
VVGVTAGFRSYSDVAFSNPSHVLPLPAGLQAGDTVIVVATASPTSGITPVPPSGFDLLLAATGGTQPATWIYRKVATASEPSAGWVWTGNAMLVAVAYYGYVAVDQVVQATSATTVYPNERMLSIQTRYQGSTGVAIGSAPSGMTQRVAFGNSSSEAAVADTDQASAGASATYAWGSGVGAARTFIVTLTQNIAPNAPTLVSPVDTSVVDVTSTQRFTWTFSDPDPGDSQSGYDLRYSSNAGSSWTTLSGTTPNTYRDIVGGTFTSGVAYEWQVRTYDSQGVVGPWSTSKHFTGGTPPAGPTVTYPVAGGTVAFSDRVDWSYPTQQAYRVRVVADASGAADTSTVYYDSTAVTDAVARTAALTFAGLNGLWVHILLSVENGGLWSAEIDRRVIVSFTPPPTPSLDLTVGDSSISATWTTAAPSGGQPAVDHVDLYVSHDNGITEARLATGLPANGDWTWWTPASGVDYSFRVASVATSGVESTTGWVDTATVGSGDALDVPPLVSQGEA